MSNMLIRDVDPGLKRRLEESARRNRRSLSDEAKDLMRRGLAAAPPERPKIPPGKLGDYLFSLLPDEFRGDDLVFEVDDYPDAPEFK